MGKMNTICIDCGEPCSLLLCPECDAKARLSDAAPELVDVLRMVANHHCVGSHDGSYTMAITADEMAQIRDALARVDGAVRRLWPDGNATDVLDVPADVEIGGGDA